VRAPWIDSSGNETGDKSTWITLGQGASQDITVGTGRFAVQSTWANDYNGGSAGCNTKQSDHRELRAVSSRVEGGLGDLALALTVGGALCSSLGGFQHRREEDSP
jgi:hypothetical protein